MSKPTAAMELMFSERLQKMRDPIGTAYVEGEGGDKGSGSLPFVAASASFVHARPAPFLECVSPVEATSASSACPVQDGTSSGRGSDRGADVGSRGARGGAWCPRWPRATPRRSARRARRRRRRSTRRARARGVESFAREAARARREGAERAKRAPRTRRRACARTRRSRARRTRTTHGTVCVWCRSVARTTRSRGVERRHRAPDIFARKARGATRPVKRLAEGRPTCGPRRRPEVARPNARVARQRGADRREGRRSARPTRPPRETRDAEQDPRPGGLSPCTFHEYPKNSRERTTKGKSDPSRSITRRAINLGATLARGAPSHPRCERRGVCIVGASRRASGADVARAGRIAAPRPPPVRPDAMPTPPMTTTATRAAPANALGPRARRRRGPRARGAQDAARPRATAGVGVLLPTTAPRRGDEDDSAARTVGVAPRPRVLRASATPRARVRERPPPRRPVRLARSRGGARWRASPRDRQCLVAMRFAAREPSPSRLARARARRERRPQRASARLGVGVGTVQAPRRASRTSSRIRVVAQKARRLASASPSRSWSCRSPPVWPSRYGQARGGPPDAGGDLGQHRRAGREEPRGGGGEVTSGAFRRPRAARRRSSARWRSPPWRRPRVGGWRCRCSTTF